MNGVRLGVRNVKGFDLADGRGKTDLLSARKRGRFDHLSILPKKPATARAELVEHRVQQTRRRRDRSKGSKCDMHFVNLIELAGGSLRHTGRHTRRRAS